MNRADVARILFERHGGKFTNADLIREFPRYVYTGRNGVSELRDEMREKGFNIRFEAGERFEENTYILEPIPKIFDGNQQVMF